MHHLTASIAAGQSLSGVVNQDDLRNATNEMLPNSSVLSGLYIPSGWTTAPMTFVASYDGVNFSDVYDAQGNEYVVTDPAGKHIILDTYSFKGIRYFKIRSGTSGTPVNQVSAASIIMAFRAQ